MLAEERIAAGRLAGGAFAEIVGSVRDTHAAIAGRAFAGLGEPSAGAERAHAAIAALAYTATEAIGNSVCAVAGRVAALATGSAARPLDDSQPARIVRGALSGAFGDRLEQDRNALAVRMAIRVGARDLELSPADVAAAFPGAGPRVAVFLHGLCETDDAWRLHAGRSRPYGERLHEELGLVPVYVRYNSGLPVPENGRLLAQLLDELERAWPGTLEQLTLIGHSMGGLVARSACHFGAASPWVAKVRHIVTLGTPHTGAPLERGAQALESALARLPETRPLARALGRRSAGIKDCGHGTLTDDGRQVAYLEGASHRFLAASLAREHDHPFGRYVGDLLVLHSSAWGGWRQSEPVRFAADSYLHVGGASHFSLLNHPAVAAQLIRWLGQRP